LHNLIYSGYGRAELMLAAYKWARDNPEIGPDRALDWANEALNGTAAQRQAFETQASREGLTGTRKAIRVNELFEQRLPPETLEAADFAGTRANAFEKPKGMPGMIAAFVGKAAEKWPELHLVMPIVRLPMNLLNNAIDMSPLGFARYFGWGRGPEGYLTRRGELQYKPEQLDDLKHELLTSASVGTALTMGLIANTMIKGPDGKPIIQINGTGPVDKDKQHQLLAQGWQPHSIQIGKLSIPFEAFPGWLVLEAIGNYQDAMRYDDMPDPATTLGYTLGRTWGAMLDRSTLRGLSDLVDSFKEVAADPTKPGKISNLMRVVGRIGEGSVPFLGANYLKQVYQQFLDDKAYQAGGWGAVTRDLPVVASIVGNKPILNALGEPVTMSPLTHRFWSNTPDDQVWRFLSEHEGLWLPKVGAVRKATAVKLFGHPLTEEQRYNYTAFRGQHLRELIANNLDVLRAETDEDRLGDRVKALGKAADKMGLRDLIEGKEPQF
jgi:hypothetical protein